LTQKEAEVLLWVAQGKSNGEVGLILGITEATAKKHLENIFAKLGVEKRGAASLIALEALVA
jgi:DNA-binding CsgD family transcriptional regulator